SKQNYLFDISVKNVLTNKAMILLTDNCKLIIESNNTEMAFSEGAIIFIERGIRFSYRIQKINKDYPPCKIIKINKEDLIKLRHILHEAYPLILNEKSLSRNMEDKIFKQNYNDESRKLFKSIFLEHENNFKALKIAYLISKMDSREKLIMSIYASAATTFSDRIRELIEKDLSKKWRLNMIADAFNISEVSVRKRLEAENISFYKILADSRMNKALTLLLDSDYHLPKIAKCVGISSSSYLIKTFKHRFGVTPKQMSIYFRCGGQTV
ncbi:helix-turn-helix transcriptional regulator, partial [Salmonella enterica]|nr:helix-turn-helix transcriptional regulator [Salmonella enterica]